MEKKYYIFNIKDHSFPIYTYGDNDEFAFKIDDSSLNRILNHSEKGMFIISASRSTNDYKTNVALTKQLEQDIRNEGLGFISTLGGYVENIDNEKVAVEELSFVVPYKESYGSYDKFVKFAIELCRKYKQESVLVQVPIINGGNATYLNGNEDIEMIFSSLGIKQENEPYYTRLKKGSHNDKPFTFRDFLEDTLKPYGHYRRIYLTRSGKESHKNDLDMQD